jgi:hypothetical protein
MYRAVVDAALYIPVVLRPKHPYALETPTFSFAPLIAFAARAPLGGTREIALAAFVTARMAEDSMPDRLLAADIREGRAAGARRWLSTLTIPETSKQAFLGLIGATERGPAECAAALRRVIEVTGDSLDNPSRTALERLVRELEAQPIGGA